MCNTGCSTAIEEDGETIEGESDTVTVEGDPGPAGRPKSARRVVAFRYLERGL